MTKSIHVLLIEDNPGDARLVKEMLNSSEKGHFEITHVERVSQGLERLDQGDIDFILSDLKLPDSSGLETFQKLHTRKPDIPLILLTGNFAERDLAVQTLQEGAQDYLMKGEINVSLLSRAIIYAIERKHADEKVQEAARLKSDLMSMVSHELRNPMAAISESINLSLELGLESPKAKELLQIAQDNVQRLVRLINDFLNFQKIDIGKVALKIAAEDINALVLEAVKTFLPMAAKKNLSVKNLLVENPPFIPCDKDKITQVLTNFVSNALKFCEKGTITVTTQKGGNWVKVSVSDQGPGISEKDQKRLFQGFSQIATNQNREEKGTGLGLAISKRIIDSHQGKIGLESQPGKGSTFYFILPIEERRK